MSAASYPLASRASTRGGPIQLSPNPLRGLRWYVDPVEPAYRSYRTFVRKHRGQRGVVDVANSA